MGVEEYGVRAVLDGVGQFLSGINQINRGVASLGAQANRTSVSIEQLGYVWDRALRRWRDASGRFVTSGRVINEFTEQLEGANEAMEDMPSATENIIGGLDQITNGFASSVAGIYEQVKALGATSTAAGWATGAFVVLNLTLGALKIAANLAVAALNTIINALKTIVNAVARAVSSLAAFLSQIAKVAIGVSFGLMIRDLSQYLRELSSDMLDTVGAFQMLEIQFETIAARDISKQLGVPISEALSQASAQAQGLLEWVKKLSLTSPYPAKSLAQTLALANAYGLQADEAMNLIEATNDFTAAMGLSDEHMYRIIYNFGQMRQQGKLTGREFRDLAISFVPVYDIIREMAEEAGTSFEEMRDAALEGLVPVDAFFAKFSEVMQRDFSGAAQKMSRTMTGLINKFKDFFQLVIGLNILGPTVDYITEKLGKLLDVLLSEEFLETARMFGLVLKESFLVVEKAVSSELLPALKELGSALGFTGFSAESAAQGMAGFAYGIRDTITWISSIIREIADWIGETFGEIQENGYTYGRNLIMSFAKGMGSAIKFIVSVITAIAKLISSWFKPGSPPKIAPKIDIWGTELGAEYARNIPPGIQREENLFRSEIEPAITTGLTQAGTAAATSAASSTASTFAEQLKVDFSGLLKDFGSSVMVGIAGAFDIPSFDLFNELTETATGFLRSLSTRLIPEEGLIPRILGTRKAIAEAVKGVRDGATSVSAAFSRISSAMGHIPAGFEQYLSQLLQLEEANKNLALAEQLSIDTLELSSSILSRMSGTVRNSAQEYVYALKNMAAAQKEVEEAELTLDAVTKQYDETLRSLRAQLSDVTEEYDEQKRLAKIQEAISSGLLTAEERERLEMERRGILLKQQIRTTEEQRDTEVAAARERVDAARIAENAAVNEAQLRQKLLADIAKAQADYAQAQVDTTKQLIEMQTEQNELIQEQIDLLTQLAAAQKGSGGVGDEAWGDIPDWGVPALDLPSAKDITDKVNEIMANAEKAFLSWKERMKSAIAEALGYDSWDELTTDFEEKVIEPITGAVDSLEEWWNTKGKSIWDDVTGAFDIGKKNLSGPIERFAKAMGRLHFQLDRLFSGWSTNEQGAQGLLTWLADLASGWLATEIGKLNAAIEALARTLDFLNTFFVDPFKKTHQQTQGVLNDPEATFGEKLAAGANEVVQGTLNALAILPVGGVAFIANFVDASLDEFERLREESVGNSIIPEMMDTMYNVFETRLGDILLLAQGWSTDVIADLESKWGNFKTNWSSTWEGVKTVAEEKWTEISTAMSTKAGEIKTNVETRFNEMKTNLGTTVETIRTTISTKFGDVKTNVGTRLGEIKTDWDSKWGAIKTKVQNVWNNPDGIVQTVIRGVSDFVTPLNTTAATEINNFRNNVLSKLQGGFDAVASAVGDAISAIRNFISWATSSALAKARNAWAFVTGRSPSPLAVGISTAVKEMQRFSRTVPMFTRQLASMNRVSQTAQPMNVSNRNVEINVNANYGNIQSPAGIYWDISAALQSARI